MLGLEARNSPSNHPRILLAILAKQKEPVLPFYLRCIEALEYPKDAIVLYVRTNNNTDRTGAILKDWIARVGHQYAKVIFDDRDVETQVQKYGVHEWNVTRFRVLALIRQESMQMSVRENCDFYFVVDVDNFLFPNALAELVALNLPVVGPLLRHVEPTNPYANYHLKADPNGYYLDCEEYYWILRQRVRGIVNVDVIHCTYLVRRDVVNQLTYEDGSGRYEYVIFSDSARRNGIGQFLDNREIYGYLTLDERPEAAMRLMADRVTMSCEADL